jgi:hypothetical protein
MPHAKAAAAAGVSVFWMVLRSALIVAKLHWWLPLRRKMSIDWAWVVGLDRSTRRQPVPLPESKLKTASWSRVPSVSVRYARLIPGWLVSMANELGGACLTVIFVKATFWMVDWKWCVFVLLEKQKAPPLLMNLEK